MKDGWHRNGTYTVEGKVRASVENCFWGEWAGLILNSKDGSVFFEYHARTRREAREWCERQLKQKGE